MARRMIKCVSFSFLIILLLSSLLSQTQARPINALKISTPSSGIGGFHFQGILQGLSLGAIKDSGPSPGQGNKSEVGIPGNADADGARLQRATVAAVVAEAPMATEVRGGREGGRFLGKLDPPELQPPDRLPRPSIHRSPSEEGSCRRHKAGIVDELRGFRREVLYLASSGSGGGRRCDFRRERGWLKRHGH
ncbi:hypothetical protein U1Q18_039203, partial [Sarracenia purpurea var. burkii]